MEKMILMFPRGYSVDIWDISLILCWIEFKNVSMHSVVNLLYIDLPYVPVL